MKIKQDDYRILRLLRMAPFEHRRLGWRFGTKRIEDQVIARLVAAGRAVRIGNQVRKIA